MNRKAHLVGAWPGRSAPAAMEDALRRLGPHLLRMTDGETGERSQWITPPVEWMRANPDIEFVRDAGYTSYEDTPQLRLREGRTLNPDTIHLQQYMYFSESYPAFKVLRERHGYPDIRFQVGVPAPIDLATAIFGHGFGDDGAMGDLAGTEALLTASVREIEQIYAEARDDVVFQIETVVAMVAVVHAPPGVQEQVAAQMASSLAQVAERSPEGSRFGAHLCLGDFHHQAMVEMGDARPLVLLANALVDAWPDGRPLDYIHTPFCAAGTPASFDEAWYAPLSWLALPEDIRFVAGFVHEKLSLEELQRVQAIIEERVGRPVDVGATCGLARRPDPAQAWDAMEKTAALLARTPARAGDSR